ncbi:homoserine O-succinyltransferase [Albimonas sp. CAU 1670]|uniref:homoserine O-succinyltransferase n=1 Tax=Albimonas sp. CAU 1670 TaxID=3032599 RepID=UPI0023DA5CFC|nr:homoserine O-succinyltransferase [Albimonas sp. CAU 1670]MDF2232704.1 homoserine O-succinyltransferase [Albimonas sp. CAU 1670]
MPIKIPAGLPAIQVLDREGVMVMSDDAAVRQDIRPLHIGLVNLMPTKQQTETQFARLIGATPLQIELTLIRMTEHASRNTSPEHLEAFYAPFAEIAESGGKFDGLIVTGAPVERLPFEEVTYWDELCRIFDWAQSHVHASLGVCWGGQAMLAHYRGVPKRDLEEKAFGIYRHRVLAPASPYLRGFSDDFSVPVSRWTETREADFPPDAGLRTLIASDEVGACLVEDPGKRALYMFNHLEYDRDTLRAEYDRDVAAGGPIRMPRNYFPDDDPTRPVMDRWRSHAHLLYGNWVNQIYQTTPYDRALIGQVDRAAEEEAAAEDAAAG